MSLKQILYNLLRPPDVLIALLLQIVDQLYSLLLSIYMGQQLMLRMGMQGWKKKSWTQELESLL